MAHPRRPIPYGFEEYVKSGHHTMFHLHNYYHCNYRTLSRWLEESNIKGTSQRMRSKFYEVAMCDINTGEEVDFFASLTEAAAAVHGRPQNIMSAATGALKTAYGFKWRFLHDST